MNAGSVCRFCGSIHTGFEFSTVDIFKDHFELHRCADCDTVFLYPYPTDEQLQNAYADDYYGEKEEKFESLFEKIVDGFRRRRAVRLSRRLDKGAAVLDVGCGNGKFLQELNLKKPCRLFGVEPGKKQAERAGRIPEITLKQGVLEAGDFPDESMDAVTLFHVFEHLPEPAKTLEIVDRVLKPGGLLVLSMPNINSLQSKWFRGKWLHLDPPRHLLFLPISALDREMRKRGFEPVSLICTSFEQNPFGFIQSFFNLFFSRRELLFESMKGNMKYTGGRKYFFQKIFAMFMFPFLMLSDLVLAVFRKSATFERTYRKKSTLREGKE